MEKLKRYRRELADWDETTRRRKITLTNPVFIKGLALAPLVIAGTSVMNCMILSIRVILLLTPTRIVTSAITQRMSVPLKTFFYPLVSALIFGPVYYLMYRLIGRPVLLLGVYLPILVVDPLIVKNFEKTRKEPFKYSVINGLRNTGGFVLACLIFGTVRELLARGTVLGFKVLPVGLLPMARNSFGGFLVMGVICAIWQAAVDRYHEKLIREVGANE